ncbi:glutaminyl-peptide cyclotransferase [Sphingomonas rubra]|uniref:Glutamine cyclotransferase n=1 Tax=Sphingomonas rubra TaxID=634430 RepID=A0A1I5T6C9_9SPHN|nr:glutaminyl-peptide cyclotransferase [Sphingomonas rubra]SFP78602.1 Glutamine cyclotransferase [Sphingomonas rubra]
MTRLFPPLLLPLIVTASALPAQTAPRPAPSSPVQAAPAPRPPMVGVTVVARTPHDPTAFTEGLIWHDGALYESVGREGQSDVRRVRLADGKVERRATIPPTQFGEGLAAWGRELISLTWHDGIAHRWDARTLRATGMSRFAGEGWGLASDGKRLIHSDGSATLRFLDPKSLREQGRVTVTFAGKPLDQINELEWVGDSLLANVWHQPFLVRIDTATGRVTQLIDLRPLVAEVAATDPEAVANGIAFDPATRRLFVTGKLWPTMFEIKLDR